MPCSGACRAAPELSDSRSNTAALQQEQATERHDDGEEVFTAAQRASVHLSVLLLVVKLVPPKEKISSLESEAPNSCCCLEVEACSDEEPPRSTRGPVESDFSPPGTQAEF